MIYPSRGAEGDGRAGRLGYTGDGLSGREDAGKLRVALLFFGGGRSEKNKGMKNTAFTPAKRRSPLWKGREARFENIRTDFNPAGAAAAEAAATVFPGELPFFLTITVYSKLTSKELTQALCVL